MEKPNLDDWTSKLLAMSNPRDFLAGIIMVKLRDDCHGAAAVIRIINIHAITCLSACGDLLRLQPLRQGVTPGIIESRSTVGIFLSCLLNQYLQLFLYKATTCH